MKIRNSGPWSGNTSACITEARVIGRGSIEASYWALFDKGSEKIRARMLSSNKVGNASYREFGSQPGETTEIIFWEESYIETTCELHDIVLQ